jgi:hypothetical protein
VAAATVGEIRFGAQHGVRLGVIRIESERAFGSFFSFEKYVG